ncbi:MAG: hypothetical protein RBT74_04550 [Tenuifilaceae bacterium]|jgi:hypothetical protein|nr:hypothetical protein [Tenuifilaceae bacterium]
MKHVTKRFFTTAALLFAALFINSSCQKDEVEATPPVVSFETSQIAVNTDDNDFYNVKLRLSSPAHKDIAVKIDVSGTAVENEHFSLPAKEIPLVKGDTEGVLPITILNENIWDEELTIEVLIAPGTDYSIDPQLTNKIIVKLTKEIVLPEIGFASTASIQTNPFKAETIKIGLVANEVLTYDISLAVDFDGELTLGEDFLLNGAAENTITFAQGTSTHEIEITIAKVDEAGFNKNIGLTLTAADPKKVAIPQETNAMSLELVDPVVDLSAMLKTVALLGGEGYQIYQQIMDVNSLWNGKVLVNASVNPNNSNYLKSHRNLYFYDAFDCYGNTIGGDVLRLADMLRFATTDTTIADYGVGRTSRFFSPTDSLFRFVAESKDVTAKGSVTAPRQKFTAKLILKEDWETGVNTEKQWHVDSKATGGVIENSTVPTFHTVEVWLEKLEGTYDFTAVEPEIVFEAWYSSTSEFFMRSYPEELDIVKDGDFYKVTYRLYPR